MARLGVLASDDVLIYGAAGVSIGDGAFDEAAFGAGIEFAATDNLSIRGQFMRYSSSFSQIAAGLIWHLN